MLPKIVFAGYLLTFFVVCASEMVALFTVNFFLTTLFPLGQLLVWGFMLSFFTIIGVGSEVLSETEEAPAGSLDEKVDLLSPLITAGVLTFIYFCLLFQLEVERPSDIDAYTGAFRIFTFLQVLLGFCMIRSFFVGCYYLFTPHPAADTVKHATASTNATLAAKTLAEKLRPEPSDAKLPDTFVSVTHAHKAEELRQKAEAQRKRYEREAQLAEEAIEMERARHRRNDTRS